MRGTERERERERERVFIVFKIWTEWEKWYQIYIK